MSSLVINGTGRDDTIVITATGTDSGSYSINGGEAIAFSGLTSLAVTGGAGNDTLTIVNPDGGLLAPAGGISYDGGGDPADALEVLGGTATDATYTAGATPDAGTLAYVGAAGTQTIQFAGIAPIVDTVTAASLTIIGSGLSDAISVTDGGLANGFQSTLVSSAGTFESVQFANKTTVSINGNGGIDTINFNNPTVAAGLLNLIVNSVSAVTQSSAVNYNNLGLNVSGAVTLNGANDVASLAASVTGAGSPFVFNDTNGYLVSSVGGIAGITTNSGPISLTTGGAIIVGNVLAGPDINAGTGTVLLASMPTSGVGYLNLQGGAAVQGTGGVVLEADNLLLDAGAIVNAGAATATLRTHSPGMLIDLGGADSVTTLGLTDTELDGITAGILRIGDTTAGDIGISAAISPAGTNQLELITGGSILDNHVGTPDIAVTRLGMDAGTGISAVNVLGVAVSNLEAQSATGNILINNIGTVTIGGVSPALQGLKVTTSGSVNFFTIGSILLSDINGSATVQAGSSSGSVSLATGGGNSDVISTVNHDAILAPHGSISVIANRDIAFGTAGASFDGDVRANGDIFFNAGRDINISGDADVASDAFGNNTGGEVTATALRHIFVSNATGTGATLGAEGNGGGSVTLNAGTGSFVELSAPSSDAVFSVSGDVAISADRMVIGSTSGIHTVAAGHSVTIQPVSPAWAINLGSPADLAASTLELSDAELDRIVTSLLRVGSTANTGDITLSSQITANGHYDTLSLRTGGAIIDGTAGEAADVTVSKLALRAATGIGSANDIDTAVSNLAFNNTTSGGVNIANTGALTIGAVDGLAVSSSASSAFVAVRSSGGAMTVAADVTSMGVVQLEVQDLGAAGDNLTVLSGITVQSTVESIQLLVGDNFTLQSGATLLAADSVFIAIDFILGDAVGGTAILDGTVIAGATIELSGQDDSDTLTGSAGNEALNGGGGADIMAGRAGNDTYVVDSSFDVINENAAEGTDLVISTASFALPANVENLVLPGGANLNGSGNALVNTITGGPGNNSLDGGGGADTMTGGGGNDSYVVDSSFDTVTENAAEGTDNVYAGASYGLAANVENLVLTGTGNLNGTGNALVNTIVGNSGDNSLDGMGGADTMAGGGGNDSYFVDNSLETIGENLGEGTDLVFAGASYGLAANVENLVLLGIGNLNGFGNALVNSITGNSGNNSLDGMGGADTMAGGGGNDTYFVDDNFETVSESLGEGTDIVFASVSYGLAANVENLVLLGVGNINGSGNGLVNSITGNSGNNSLDGMGGVDTMVGAAGNDTYFVDSSFETVSENAAEGTDIVFAGASFGLSLNVENLVLTGVGNFNGSGNALVNVISGNSGNNSLDGGAGADTMVGGAGNDSYFVDSSFETIGENVGEGTDIAFASASYGLAANVENLVLTGVGNINGSGNALVNTLTGNSGNNSLDGGVGADTMAGGAGTDIYYVDNNFEVINESPGEGTDTVYASISYQVGNNLEFLFLQGSANINGFGNSVTNYIEGNSGDNGLNGGGGTDALVGQGGNDLFIFQAGEANGDIVNDFAGNGALIGDQFQFVGFGTIGGGASFTNVGGNQWQIHSGLDAHNEIITLANGASVNASDFFFT